MKILIVVVLAMATKKLAVGITLSTSALLFIEYVGKRMVCFFEPCLKLLSSSKFLIRRFEIVESNSSCCTIDEIEIEDSGSRTDLVIANEPDLDTPLNRCHERLGHKEEETLQLRMRDLLEEEDEEIMEHQNRRRRNRGAKIKPKVMKKFAPKKKFTPNEGAKLNIKLCKTNWRERELIEFMYDSNEWVFGCLPRFVIATLFAKQWHFAYITPSKTRVFLKTIDFGDPSEFDEIEALSALKQSESHTSRISGKKLADISVALFSSQAEEQWRKKGLLIDTEEY